MKSAIALLASSPELRAKWNRWVCEYGGQIAELLLEIELKSKQIHKTLTIEYLDRRTRAIALENPDWKEQYDSFRHGYGTPTAERYLAMAWAGRNKTREATPGRRRARVA